MNILCFPSNLASGSNIEGVQMFDYQTSKPSVKNRVVLSGHVFSFLIEGTKGIFTEDKYTSIDNQEFLVIRSGSCLMTENISDKNMYRSILLFFDHSALSDFCSKAGVLTLRNDPGKAYTICKYDAYVQQFVGSLIHIKQSNLHGQQGLLKAKFEEIMYYLINRCGPGFVEQLMSWRGNEQKNFIRIVESNRLSNLTLDELAFLSNMSISTFKRNFKAHYQVSPMKWFQQKRLEHAAYLLKMENKRPSDIYLEVGFESLSSFTQAFKQKYNCTPKQFRVQ